MSILKIIAKASMRVVVLRNIAGSILHSKVLRSAVMLALLFSGATIGTATLSANQPITTHSTMATATGQTAERESGLLVTTVPEHRIAMATTDESPSEVATVPTPRMMIVADAQETTLQSAAQTTDPSREFRLVFREQTDANVPGEIIDTLTMFPGKNVEVWFSLEGSGALADDETVTGTVSFLFSGGGALGISESEFAILPAVNRFLYRSEYTLDESGTLRVKVSLNQGGLEVAELPDTALQVTVVPREFRLVFDRSEVTLTAGNSAEVTLTLESVNGELAEGERVTVNLPSADTARVTADLSPITFSRDVMSISIRITANAGELGNVISPSLDLPRSQWRLRV